MGAAMAIGRYEVSVVLAILNLFTLEALVPLKKKLDSDMAESVTHEDPNRPDISRLD
jgi:hypothetical protein